jgi:hypothetical protein
LLSARHDMERTALPAQSRPPAELPARHHRCIPELPPGRRAALPARHDRTLPELQIEPRVPGRHCRPLSQLPAIPGRPLPARYARGLSELHPDSAQLSARHGRRASGLPPARREAVPARNSGIGRPLPAIAAETPASAIASDAATESDPEMMAVVLECDESKSDNPHSVIATQRGDPALIYAAAATPSLPLVAKASITEALTVCVAGETSPRGP